MTHTPISRRRFLGSTGAALGAAAAFAPGRALARAASALSGSAPLQLVRVPVADAASARLLDGFDLSCGQTHNNALEMILWPGDAARLRALGFDRWTVVVDDLVALDRAAGLDRPSLPVDDGVPGERTAYRRLPDFLSDMQSLVSRFPDKARLFTMPEPSREGRQVTGIEICSDVTRDDGRPVYYMDGIHHAREWPAAEMPIMLAFDLLESYATDAQVRNVVDNVRTMIVPVMNPDGYSWSREAVTDIDEQQYAYWRKNRRGVTGLTVPVVQRNPDAYGVDPNRNYAFNWGGDGSSASQTSGTHRGDAPFSEPETRNTRSVLRSRSVMAMISNHTYGNLILRPWGFVVSQQPPDVGILKGVGDAMAKFNKYTSQTSLQLYVTTGTSPDWAYGAFGTIGYVFEHGTAFHPNYTGVIPLMYTKNRGAFLLLGETAANPAYHGIIRGRAVDPSGNALGGARVRITSEFQTPLWNLGDGTNPTGQPTTPDSLDIAMTANADGTFNFHVNPSTRPLVAAVGGSEPYALTAEHHGSTHRVSAPRPVTIGRGQIADLGDLVLS